MRIHGSSFGVGSATALALLAGMLASSARAQTSLPASQSPVPQTATSAPVQPPADGAETLDRIVAVVNGQLVLDSDVNQEQRLLAFEPYPEPGHEMTRDRIIERLINRALILQQLKLTPEEPVTDQQLDAEIANLKKTIPACRQAQCTTDAGWRSFLAEHGFTEAQFRSTWRTRMQVLRFIEERFRMGVLISPADVQKYFQQEMLPQYAERHVSPPKLDATLEKRISAVLLQQQVSRLLGDWLSSLRSQGSVVVLKPGEVAP